MRDARSVPPGTEMGGRVIGKGIVFRSPAMSVPASLSVIIPTWNEAPLVADAVCCAFALGDEVIVVDGGSPDATAAVARRAGATVLVTAKGRGVQIDAGARGATGDVLLFLHADARLGRCGRDAILGAFSNPGVVGGNFLVRFLPESWFTRVLVPANDLRRRLTRRYYGDSGIFVRRTLYLDLGGVKPWPIMHDFELSGRMERAGRCVYIREPSIFASARRFRGREMRTLGVWLTIRTLYRFGFPPRLLARAYPDLRGSDTEDFIAEARRRISAG